MRQRALLLVLCALLGGAACGKKGPPLPPLVRLPPAVGDISARRLSNQVVLRFTIPAANTDGSRPADLDRIEVYAHTGPLGAADFLTKGTLIGTVAVKPPPPPPEETEGQPQPARAAAAAVETADQGSTASIAEILTPDLLAFTPPGTPPAEGQTPGGASTATFSTPSGTAAATTAAQATQKQPSRYYMAVGLNTRGRRGTPSRVIGVPLVTAPPPPTGAEVAYDQKTISIGWKPPVDSALPVVVVPPAPLEPPGVSEPVVDALPPAPLEPPVVSEPPGVSQLPVVSEPTVVSGSRVDSAPAVDSPPPATPNAPAFRYNIYEVKKSPGQDMTVPTPLNASPVTTLLLVLTALDFGHPRCYVVRTVADVDKVTIESEPSEPVCVTPLDTFPPAAPRALAAVATASAVSLIWEANTEEDLAGYLVLRGEAPGEKLTPLTPVPIRETTYTDTQVRADVTYVYAVVAQDNTMPPNVSQYSDLVPVVPK